MEIKPRFFVSISIQISVFLILIAFIPVAITMALKTYEKQLLELTERSNVQQGRILSASLSQSDLDSKKAGELLLAMKGNFDARIRIIGIDKKLLADSATISFHNENATDEKKATSSSYEVASHSADEVKKSAEKRLLYRLFSLPVRVYRKFFRPPSQNPFATDYYTAKALYDGKEISAALQGFYGSTTRFSADGATVTLYSALPIFNGKTDSVQGVVLVSSSTYKILRNLYELRLDLGKVFLGSLIFVLLVSIFFAFRITLPLKHLAAESEKSADSRGRLLSSSFTGKKRHDEIGVLSRSFSALLEKLSARIRFIESFSSDVSHEFKNPLAAIRSCTEVLENENLSGEERQEFTKAITEEVTHLQNLLTGVRNISKIDAGLSESEKSDLLISDSCKNIIFRLEKSFSSINFLFSTEDESIRLKMPADYFDRIAENLIENAAGFAKSEVSVKITGGKNSVSLIVEDDGKGISENSREKIFNRFYSKRNESDRQNHTGLGLATVKAIADATGAIITVGKSQSLGGAKFEIRFQLSSKN